MSDPDVPNATEQPLLAHLVELRTRVVRALMGIGLVLIPLLFYSKELYHYLAIPLIKLLPAGSSMIQISGRSNLSSPESLTNLCT